MIASRFVEARFSSGFVFRFCLTVAEVAEAKWTTLRQGLDCGIYDAQHSWPVSCIVAFHEWSMVVGDFGITNASLTRLKDAIKNQTKLCANMNDVCVELGERGEPCPASVLKGLLQCDRDELWLRRQALGQSLRLFYIRRREAQFVGMLLDACTLFGSRDCTLAVTSRLAFLRFEMAHYEPKVVPRELVRGVVVEVFNRRRCNTTMMTSILCPYELAKQAVTVADFDFGSVDQLLLPEQNVSAQWFAGIMEHISQPQVYCGFFQSKGSYHSRFVPCPKLDSQLRQLNRKFVGAFDLVTGVQRDLLVNKFRSCWSDCRLIFSAASSAVDASVNQAVRTYGFWALVRFLCDGPRCLAAADERLRMHVPSRTTVSESYRFEKRMVVMGLVFSVLWLILALALLILLVIWKVIPFVRPMFAVLILVCLCLIMDVSYWGFLLGIPLFEEPSQVSFSTTTNALDTASGIVNLMILACILIMTHFMGLALLYLLGGVMSPRKEKIIHVAFISGVSAVALTCIVVAAVYLAQSVNADVVSTAVSLAYTSVVLFVLSLSVLLCLVLCCLTVYVAMAIRKRGGQMSDVWGVWKLFCIFLALLVAQVFRLALHAMIQGRHGLVVPEWFKAGVVYVGLGSLTYLAFLLLIFQSAYTKWLFFRKKPLDSESVSLDQVPLLDEKIPKSYEI